MKSFFQLNISYLMNVKNIKQKSLADAIGVSSAVVSTWVSRGSLPKDIDTFIKIADFFEISLDTLFRVNIEECGADYKTPDNQELELFREEVEHYKAKVKELKDDKKTLKKAVDALSSRQPRSSGVLSRKKSRKV